MAKVNDSIKQMLKMMMKGFNTEKSKIITP